SAPIGAASEAAAALPRKERRSSMDIPHLALPKPERHHVCRWFNEAQGEIRRGRATARRRT
ncbi:hypothetical protein, partial [Sphingobium yanoikuyae]|uniref:hypothetical protein n=1 Tax=Sphingobium yanoikuyae TaxID=13690 RepID=UPI001BDF70D9